MEIEVITRYDDFLKIKDSWSDLLKHSFNNVIFSTFEWLCAWWEVYGQGNELFVILVKDNGTITAAAPLMIKNIRFGGVTLGKKLQFIAHDVSDYSDFIVTETDGVCFDLIFKELARRINSWDYAEFIFIPENSPNFEHWKHNIAGFKANIKSVTKDSSAYILNMYKTADSWQGFEKTLPAKRRNDLKRCSKLLSGIGDLKFSSTKEPALVSERIDRLIAFHKERWHGKGLKSQFCDPRVVLHYRAIMRNFSSQGWLELASMTLNNEYLALAIGYTYNHRYYYYMPAFNRTYSKYSPGNLLIKNLLESFYPAGQIRIFDLLRGDEAYKSIWSDAKVALFRIKMYPKKPKTKLLYFLKKAASFIK
jgi:CelD/BcsL family acetyltransferase involved in cellulose biosynthesis